MFVLDWTAYPFIMLAVAVPMAAFYAVERRREQRDEAAYDGPCMAHTGTDTDGTELWCWQKSGHSGTHDDYTAHDQVSEGIRRLIGCPEIGCLFDLNHDGPHMCGVEGVDMRVGEKCFLPDGHTEDHQPFDNGDGPDLFTYVPHQGVCGIELGIDSRCVRAPRHLGECSDF